MDSKDFDAWQERIRRKSEELWEAQGRPDEGPAHFEEMARELLAIAENPHATTQPVQNPRVPDGEPLLAVRNLGEFPTLTDQGEEQAFPDPDPGAAEDGHDDGPVRKADPPA